MAKTKTSTPAAPVATPARKRSPRKTPAAPAVAPIGESPEGDALVTCAVKGWAIPGGPGGLGARAMGVVARMYDATVTQGFNPKWYAVVRGVAESGVRCAAPGWQRSGRVRG